MLGAAGFWLALSALSGFGLGLLGWASGWADLLNQFAAVWACLAAIGGLLGLCGPDRRTARRAAILAALALLGSGGQIGMEMLAGRRQAEAAPPPSSHDLKILTFNAWNSNVSPEEAAAIVRASGADLVAMQEPKRVMPDRALVADLYPYATPCRWGCDVAILSKRPFIKKRRLFETGEDGRRGALSLLMVETMAPDGRPVRLATTHLLWPIPPGPQRIQRGLLGAAAKGLAPQDLILTGDFNLNPWSFALRGLDGRLRPMTRRTRGIFSFPTMIRLAPFPFLAIDQVYAGPAWRTVKIERAPYGGSDHFPVLATLVRS